jgi:hypothetical protein
MKLSILPNLKFENNEEYGKYHYDTDNDNTTHFCSALALVNFSLVNDFETVVDFNICFPYII